MRNSCCINATPCIYPGHGKQKHRNLGACSATVCTSLHLKLCVDMIKNAVPLFSDATHKHQCMYTQHSESNKLSLFCVLLFPVPTRSVPARPVCTPVRFKPSAKMQLCQYRLSSMVETAFVHRLTG